MTNEAAWIGYAPGGESACSRAVWRKPAASAVAGVSPATNPVKTATSSGEFDLVVRA